ncbi:D-alanyl-D-alanine carboxypeptidase/D-alanyl-D-alanine-endopeptidase [Dermabacteraceae bacterium P7074]
MRLRDRILRVLAVVLCAALPLSFYAVGDVTDTFPGFLTFVKRDSGGALGVPARGERFPQRKDAELVAPLSKARDLAAEKASAAAVKQVGESAPAPGSYAVSVIDADSGEGTLEHDAATPRTPASTLKLLTAMSALEALDPDARLLTTARLKGDTLTLIGGGDMLLGVGPATPGVNGRASLAALADATAENVKKAGNKPLTLHFDDALFANAPLNPAWKDNGPAGGWVAPITPLAVNRGDVAGVYGPKQVDPALHAAREFARLLRERGVVVTGEPSRAPAPRDGTDASVSSASIGELVAHTLQHSDNTVAEVLGRLVALHDGIAPTPQGAVEAVEKRIAGLAKKYDLQLDPITLYDTSGLSVDSRISPRTLARLLALVASGKDPRLIPISRDLPIAKLTGTLAKRFDLPETSPGAGLVRGKTGYLGGNTTLAGIGIGPGGRLVAYSVVVYGFDPKLGLEARAKVDRLASAVLGVGGLPVSQSEGAVGTQPQPARPENKDPARRGS